MNVKSLAYPVVEFSGGPAVPHRRQDSLCRANLRGLKQWQRKRRSFHVVDSNGSVLRLADPEPDGPIKRGFWAWFRPEFFQVHFRSVKELPPLTLEDFRQRALENADTYAGYFASDGLELELLAAIEAAGSHREIIEAFLKDNLLSEDT